MNSLKITRHSQNHLVLTPSLPPSLTHFFTSSPTKNSLQLSVPLSSHLSIYHFFLSFLFLFALYLILKSQQALTNPILSLLSRSFFFLSVPPFPPVQALPFTVFSPCSLTLASLNILVCKDSPTRLSLSHPFYALSCSCLAPPFLLAPFQLLFSSSLFVFTHHTLHS